MEKSTKGVSGINVYFMNKIGEYEHKLNEKTQNLKRLEAQRNELNNQGKRERRRNN